MDGSTILIVICRGHCAAVLWACEAYRRVAGTSGDREPKQRGPATGRTMGVRIDAPAKERSQSASSGDSWGRRSRSDAKVAASASPAVPISHQCECRYIKLFTTAEERLRQEREGRSRFERTIRRRSGKDREEQLDGSSRAAVLLRAGRNFLTCNRVWSLASAPNGS